MIFVAIQNIAKNTDLCENYCEDCTEECWSLRSENKVLSEILDTEKKAKYLAVKKDKFLLEKVVNVYRTEERSLKKRIDPLWNASI